MYNLKVECRTFNPGVLGSNPNTLKFLFNQSTIIPQLDFLSFHSQLFWVLIFSYLLYFVCLYLFIKEMSKTIKLRVKLTLLLKKLFNVYYARYFLDSSNTAFQKIKTKKVLRKTYLYRTAMRHHKGACNI